MPRLAAAHDLLGWAIKFGKVLFQRDQYWENIVSRWKDRLPLPSAALARERAATATVRLTKMLECGDADAVHELAVSYLTHLARATLLERGVYAASRPELPSQLRATQNHDIAEQLERLLQNNAIEEARINEMLKLTA